MIYINDLHSWAIQTAGMTGFSANIDHSADFPFGEDEWEFADEREAYDFGIAYIRKVVVASVRQHGTLDLRPVLRVKNAAGEELFAIRFADVVRLEAVP